MSKKYKLVPMEPTDDMVDAGRSQSSFPLGVYKAMIAAAPAVQGEPVATVTEEVFGSDGTSDFISARLPVGTKLYTAPQPAPDVARPAIFSDEDHVSMPRGLIAAACSAIDKKRDAENVLSELRRYTLGDLSRQTEPDVAGLVDLLRDIGDVCRQLEMPSERAIAEWADRIDAALAAYRNQGGDA